MPLPILMGFEQEMPLCASGPRGGRVNLDGLLNELSEIAASTLPHLRGLGESGIFLANGMRLYLDCAKLEIASPECSHPDDVVRYAGATERIAADLTGELQRRHKLQEAALFRCNVSYGNCSSWGYHESYLTRTEPQKMASDMIPFLASRVVIAGAGGFVPGSSAACDFTLSSRATYIGLPISSSSTSTHERGIFHIKDQTLASKPYHRMHIICGEALCSHLAIWLRAGTTAVVAAMADGGIAPGRDVTLKDSVQALKVFAGDPTCKACAGTRDGRQLSAVQIQRHYLQLARENLEADWMPPFAREVVGPWEAMLCRLEEGAPASVQTCLDWAIKYRLFGRHLEKSNFSWPLLRHWSALGDWLNYCLAAIGISGLSAEAVENATGQFRTLLDLLAVHLEARGMNWEQLTAYRNLRLQLFALDFKFGQCGERGIFNCLDRAGTLDHSIAGIDGNGIELAKGNPPASGRAHVRGQAIRQLYDRGVREAANWQMVRDATSGLSLDLYDPFTNDEKWARNFGDAQRAGMEGDSELSFLMSHHRAGSM